MDEEESEILESIHIAQHLLDVLWYASVEHSFTACVCAKYLQIFVVRERNARLVIDYESRMGLFDLHLRSFSDSASPYTCHRPCFPRRTSLQMAQPKDP